MYETANGARSSTVNALVARVSELERTQAEAFAELRQLHAVAAATRRIAATRDVDEIVATLLRTMRDPLGFSRAMYFSVDRSRGIQAHLQIDGSDTIESCSEELDCDEGSVVLGVLRGEPDAIGTHGELCSPLVDVRGWYVLTSLTASDGAIGILYADGHGARIPIETVAAQVHSIGSVAAIAIENARHIAHSQALAARDALTGLYNRRAFEERLNELMSQALRSRSALAYVMIDVDDFKLINDSHGHAHGDDVLKRLASTLTASSRKGDVVGRYAGDEFAIIMADLDAELARALVARLSGELRARDLRCSLGAALFPKDAADARSLSEAADRALYNTKAAGKNGYSFY